MNEVRNEAERDEQFFAELHASLTEMLGKVKEGELPPALTARFFLRYGCQAQALGDHALACWEEAEAHTKAILSGVESTAEAFSKGLVTQNQAREAWGHPRVRGGDELKTLPLEKAPSSGMLPSKPLRPTRPRFMESWPKYHFGERRPDERERD